MTLLAGPAGDVRAPAAVRVTRARTPGVRARTLGPALLVGAGYVDPGNWGADVAAGSGFGYRLLWVLGAATLAAMMLQQLSARVGLASGCDLATLMRRRWSRRTRSLVFPPLLLALAVTEVVEVLGVVIGVQMLTSWSLTACLPLACSLTLAVLLAPSGPARATVYGCLALVGAVYVFVLLAGGTGGVVGGMVPGALPPGGLPVAVGLVGAVVMPHNILLHSALARDLAAQSGVAATPSAVRVLLRRCALTTALALGVALVVNCSIVSVAAGSGGPAGLPAALHAARPAFGPATAALFAITLIGAGLAAATTGGMINSDVLRTVAPGLRVNDATRRLLCMLPAGLVPALGLPEVAVLMWSQVVLTVALPLVLVPLILFASRPEVMGRFALGRAGRWSAWLVTGVLCGAAMMSTATI